MFLWALLLIIAAYEGCLKFAAKSCNSVASECEHDHMAYETGRLYKKQWRCLADRVSEYGGKDVLRMIGLESVSEVWYEEYLSAVFETGEQKDQIRVTAATKLNYLVDKRSNFDLEPE
ncbi:uncharacterized protein CANTADRAFT_22590 [Suhomyces tanzawaensis NRRL Y-17324]|uniref:Uncharacterized protein n=1 Tax=Suhomyces tanzawaensis NRRL Y-17324 TaxID=984487 RepID=A0A1E4SGH6_9ASCO|nr:uncharacterized protein CANTADRAFT_22590 [Suhomyces tanzawaensis NRRL Y-17324]ODV78614.1 hypothetical protein CANTADRAFT_22590 [Suhomyces tanzawaensis NRRL Y-17324]